MRTVLHEIAGWLLAIVGLLLIGAVLMLALNRYFLESFAVVLPATIVFRSGIGLVRLATAGRIATQLTERQK